MIIWANRMYPKTVLLPQGAEHDPLRESVTERNNTAERSDVSLRFGDVSSTVNNLSRVSNLTREHTVRNNSVQESTLHAPNITYHTQVQVDMVNHNQIHSERDMVKLAETLSDALYQSLISGAEGVRV